MGYYLAVGPKQTQEFGGCVFYTLHLQWQMDYNKKLQWKNKILINSITLLLIFYKCNKLQESLLETRQIQQSQQGNQNLIHISHANNLLYVPHFHDQRFQYTRPPFEMEVPRFDGTNALS